MTLFGKSLAQYMRLQWALLALTLAVGVIRLVLPFLGASPEVMRFFSINLMATLGMVVYPILVHRRAFGGVPEVWTLLVIQLAVGAIVIAAAIVFTGLTGVETIYSAPEFGGTMNPWFHAGLHLVLVPPLVASILSLPAALILFVARRTVPSTPGVG
jgi:hypothetical protein